MITEVLSAPRFAPLKRLLEDVDLWCTKASVIHGDLIDASILSPVDGELFTPLLREAFATCASATPKFAQQFIARQWIEFQAFLESFFIRLRRDATTSWFDGTGFAFPVVGLWTHDAETHNGRLRVIRLHMRGGRRVAYKPRPVGSEEFFLADGALFDLINRLPQAPGMVRLPVLQVRAGSESHRGSHSWQEWVESPAQRASIRRSGGHRLIGTRLTAAESRRFWRDGGSLAAACFGFGIRDLGEDNVVVGTASESHEPRLYPVDLEVHFAPVRRLYDTNLIADPEVPENHHPGVEKTPRWCTSGGPSVFLTKTSNGIWQLRRRSDPWTRGETRSVVVDTRGRAGYGPYLTTFLRGMFDAWVLMCRNSGRIVEFIEAISLESNVRVLLRNTSDYMSSLEARALEIIEPGSIAFSQPEIEQLERLDVPYFFRASTGGPLLFLDPLTSTPREVDPAQMPGDLVLPFDIKDLGARLTLSGIGVGIRDAIEYVFEQLEVHDIVDIERGVTLHLVDRNNGEARFDWAEIGKRIIYSWDESTIRLRVEEIPTPEPINATIRRQLLRLDRVDARLRGEWAAGGFADTILERRLRMLTDAAMRWLRTVVDENGWPGRALVGRRASDAACRLVQHAVDQSDRLKEYLELVRASARTGDVPWRQVAYLTDTLRIAEDRPQLYGTKFRMRNGRLEPFPIEDFGSVDERRRSLNMESLKRYENRIRLRFRDQGHFL
ncbi:DUF4135 domain-containing protein [Embleya sp. NPDC001921]